MRKLKMPCWSGVLNATPKMVEFAVCAMGERLRRWNGDNMLNSSWMLSEAAGVKGWRWSFEYSDISTWKCWKELATTLARLEMVWTYDIGLDAVDSRVVLRNGNAGVHLLALALILVVDELSDLEHAGLLEGPG
jgi:hypothetical protein